MRVLESQTSLLDIGKPSDAGPVSNISPSAEDDFDDDFFTIDGEEAELHTYLKDAGVSCLDVAFAPVRCGVFVTF